MIHIGGPDRLRPTVKTLGEAEILAAQYRIERKNEGAGGTILSPAQRTLAAKAFTILKDYDDVAIVEAARAFDAERKLAARSKSVRELIPLFLEDRRMHGLEEKTINGLRYILEQFAETFGDRLVSNIRYTEIKDWLNSSPDALSTRRLKRTRLSGFFTFAKQVEYLRDHPLAGMKGPKPKQKPPKFLSVPEAKALLLNADADWLPFVAISLFLGLRPEAELARLTWGDIDLKRRQLHVRASKNQKSWRSLAISDLLAAWLAPYAHQKGLVVPRPKREFVRIRRCAVAYLAQLDIAAPHLEKWPVDVLRHSYATYACGATDNEFAVAKSMGHGEDIRTIRAHYKGRITEEEALPYWHLFPSRRLPDIGEDCHIERCDGPFRDARNARRRALRLANPELIKERNRQYYQKKKAKYAALTLPPVGETFPRTSLSPDQRVSAAVL
jgi:integrase